MIRIRRTAPLALIAAGALALVSLTGCQERLDPQQYGQVLRKLPKIEGADEPYPLPKLENSQESSPEDDK